jgi:alpha-L-fucosidase
LNRPVKFYGPVTRRGSRLYLHLIMRPTDLLTLRQVPVWRIQRVTLLGRPGELRYEHNMDVQAGPDSSDDALGEVLIDAGEPTGALHDVVAVDFDRLDAP